MRIISLSLGLAAIALVSAQADPMAPAGATPPTYDWASVGDETQLVAQLEDLSYQISERALRAQFLKSIDEIAPSTAAGEEFNADGLCDSAANNLINLVEKATDNIIGSIPLVGPVIGPMIKQFIAPIKGLISGIDTGSISTLATSITSVLNTAIGLLRGIGLGVLGSFFIPLIDIIANIKDVLQTVLICKSSGGIKAKFELESCSLMADIYRSTLTQAAEAYANLPKDQAEELQRYLDGAMATIENASKTSIAPSNDALLASRPIFPADVLEQYRTEIVRNSNNNDAARAYAVANLGSVVAFSNGLEACLRIVADPTAAAEEVNEDEDEDFEDEQDDEEDQDEE
ncbi:hypothetical protein EC991_003056 [Linnemannia zychae]|nr:hypothetical protein EC991_003056 [Linnemannia zychae]